MVPVVPNFATMQHCCKFHSVPATPMQRGSVCCAISGSRYSCYGIDGECVHLELVYCCLESNMYGFVITCAENEIFSEFVVLKSDRVLVI